VSIPVVFDFYYYDIYIYIYINSAYRNDLHKHSQRLIVLNTEYLYTRISHVV
jgi:hypothetical protein